MLSPNLDTLRIFIHVLAGSVWVGGQIALAGIVPVLRKNHPESTRSVAHAFARVAWPSFVVSVATGMWSLIDVDIQGADWQYTSTVLTHVLLALTAGMAAGVHAIGRSKAALAIGGALGLLFSVGALFVGVLLRSGS